MNRFGSADYVNASLYLQIKVTAASAECRQEFTNDSQIIYHSLFLDDSELFPRIDWLMLNFTDEVLVFPA